VGGWIMALLLLPLTICAADVLPDVVALPGCVGLRLCSHFVDLVAGLLSVYHHLSVMYLASL